MCQAGKERLWRGHGIRRYTVEKIIGHLRTIEIETGRGNSANEACLVTPPDRMAFPDDSHASYFDRILH